LRRRQEELEVLENAKAARMADLQRRDEERRGRMGGSSSFGSSFANDFGPARGFETGPPAHHMMQNSVFDRPPPMQFGGARNTRAYANAGTEFGGGGGGPAPGSDMTAGVQKLLQMFKGGMSQQQSLMDTVNFGQPQSQFGQLGGDGKRLYNAASLISCVHSVGGRWSVDGAVVPRTRWQRTAGTSRRL
jgi:hypothetical protein